MTIALILEVIDLFLSVLTHLAFAPFSFFSFSLSLSALLFFFQNYYRHLRRSTASHGSSSSATASDFGASPHLDLFSQTLAEFTLWRSVRCECSFPIRDSHQSSFIVSSIEFDKNEELFGIAGVSRKIRLYSYEKVRHGMAR